ncbi:MAG TPA: DoxX family protein [Vicinamibacterales bacterium]|nr:DoxX family protein [Vicinamibacterales bacterium]
MFDEHPELEECELEITLSEERRRSETVPLLLGRAIFGGFFLYNGIHHFMEREQMSGYAKAKGVPAAGVAIPITGALLVLGGLSLLTGYKPKIGAALIGTFLAGVTPTMHAFWKDQNPQERQGDMINFMKNVALAGGALIAAGRPEPWPVSPAAIQAA